MEFILLHLDLDQPLTSEDNESSTASEFVLHRVESSEFDAANFSGLSELGGNFWDDGYISPSASEQKEENEEVGSEHRDLASGYGVEDAESGFDSPDGQPCFGNDDSFQAFDDNLTDLLKEANSDVEEGSTLIKASEESGKQPTPEKLANDNAAAVSTPNVGSKPQLPWVRRSVRKNAGRRDDKNTK